MHTSFSAHSCPAGQMQISQSSHVLPPVEKLNINTKNNTLNAAQNHDYMRL